MSDKQKKPRKVTSFDIDISTLEFLQKKAHKEERSVGYYIRKAIDKTYIDENDKL